MTTCIQMTTAQILAANFSAKKFIPIPFTILLLFYAISVIASKVHRFETFVPGCIVGFGGLFEWGSWLTILILSCVNLGSSTPSSGILIFAFIVNYILNAANIYVYKKKMELDPEL